MILAGFLLPSLFDCMAGFYEERQSQQESKSNRVRIVCGVLIGDFFHNFCDGLFLGVAFKGCGDRLGWAVFLSTVLHEIPQEIADYVILTGPEALLQPAIALGLNFLSGISVLIGAIIVVASDVSNDKIGLMLAFGAGVYLHIAATECMPRIYKCGTAWVRAASILAFIIGTVLIGLILLDHEHCVPESAATGASDGGGGHAHGHR